MFCSCCSSSRSPTKYGNSDDFAPGPIPKGVSFKDVIALEKEGWGAGVISQLAVDLENEQPEEKEFAETILKRMVQFGREYPKLFVIGAPPVPRLQNESGSNAVGQRAVAQIEVRSAPQFDISDLCLVLIGAYN